MAITTVSEIIAVKAPGYETDPRIDDFTDLAKFHISSDVFGSKYNYALALMVCHWIACEGLSGGSSSGAGSGVGGSITSEKEGDLSRSYGNVSFTSAGAASYYSKTMYGQELYQLFRSCAILPMNRCI